MDRDSSQKNGSTSTSKCVLTNCVGKSTQFTYLNENKGFPEWRSGLKHCTAVLEAPLQIQAVSQLAKTGRPMRRRTISPASPGLGEGLACRDILVPSRSSDSCGELGKCTLTRSPVVPPTHWLPG
jgi:hypothetical protein